MLPDKEERPAMIGVAAGPKNSPDKEHDAILS